MKTFALAALLFASMASAQEDPGFYIDATCSSGDDDCLAVTEHRWG